MHGRARVAYKCNANLRRHYHPLLYVGQAGKFGLFSVDPTTHLVFPVRSKKHDAAAGARYLQYEGVPQEGDARRVSDPHPLRRAPVFVQLAEGGTTTVFEEM